MSSDAKRSPVQNTAVQSASNVLTLNSSWTAINAIMMAKNTTLENFYRENSLHIPNVSNHVFAQGCRSFHYLRPITFLPVAFLINLSHSLYYCFFFCSKDMTTNQQNLCAQKAIAAISIRIKCPAVSTFTVT
jgi:hypothetical protein